MTNEEQNLPIEPDTMPDAAADDLRYAPVARAADTPETAAPASESAEAAPFSMSDGVDIEAALAAVSSLSDMLAEQEAAEQARVAQVEAEERAAEERRLRVEHPEYFFPVPPPVVLKRGQMASVLPALLLIGLGVWLTFTLTMAETPPDTALILLALGGGLVVLLLGRWLSSGRWARGSLWLGLTGLLTGGVLVYLAQPGSIGAARGWPLLLLGFGLAFILTALLAQPPERRPIVPGLLLAFAGGMGLTVTLGLLPGTLLSLATAVWPVVLLIVLIIWLLPVFRRA